MAIKEFILDKFDNSTICIWCGNIVNKESMFFEKSKRGFLGLFFLIHSFTLTNVILNSTIGLG